MNKQSVPPWEIQQGEPSKAFHFFTIYRDMGAERTLKKVALATGKAEVTINKLSQQWNWQERVRAWSGELDRIRREITLKATEDMAKRHIHTSMSFQRIMLLPVEAITNRLKTDFTGKVKDFEGTDVNKLFEKAIKGAQAFCELANIERKSRGEPNDITKQDITSGGEPIKVILPVATKKHNALD